LQAKIALVFALSIFVFLTNTLYQNVSAEDDVEQAETLEDKCAKTEGTDLDALLCKAVLELQKKVADLEAKTVIPPEVKEVIEKPDEQVIEEEMSETPEEPLDSPLMQLASGVNPDEIQCGQSQVLIFKASNSRPTCVEESRFDVLISRGWLAFYDPTLYTAMGEAISAEPQDDTVTDEETVDEDETEPGETQGKDYSVDLGESLDLGTN
jgi:hypothetical protein